jgi:hypothetical protein
MSLANLKPLKITMPQRQLKAKTSKKPTQKSAPALEFSRSAKFTLFLLLVMAMIGGGLGVITYFFGRASLRGITQPDVNPFLQTGDDQEQSPRQGVSFLKEADIIKQVKTQTTGSNAKPPEASPSPSPDAKNKDDKDKKDKTASSDPKSFPIRTKSEGVNFDVRTVKREESDLVLDIAIANNSGRPVQFIYTFLDITDDQGFALSSEIKGVPETLQANGETYVGTVRVFDIPSELERLNLKLADYPDQKVKLEINNVPLPKANGAG